MKHYNINNTRELLKKLWFTQDSENIYIYYREYTFSHTVWIDILWKAWINTTLFDWITTIKEIRFNPEITDFKALIEDLEERADLIEEAVRG